MSSRFVWARKHPWLYTRQHMNNFHVLTSPHHSLSLCRLQELRITHPLGEFERLKIDIWVFSWIIWHKFKVSSDNPSKNEQRYLRVTSSQLKRQCQIKFCLDRTMPYDFLERNHTTDWINPVGDHPCILDSHNCRRQCECEPMATHHEHSNEEVASEPHE